jgi:hypothetical protein
LFEQQECVWGSEIICLRPFIELDQAHTLGFDHTVACSLSFDHYALHVLV